MNDAEFSDFLVGSIGASQMKFMTIRQYLIGQGLAGGKTAAAAISAATEVLRCLANAAVERENQEKAEYRERQKRLEFDVNRAAYVLGKK